MYSIKVGSEQVKQPATSAGRTVCKMCQKKKRPVVMSSVFLYLKIYGMLRFEPHKKTSHVGLFTLLSKVYFVVANVLNVGVRVRVVMVLIYNTETGGFSITSDNAVSVLGAFIGVITLTIGYEYFRKHMQDIVRLSAEVENVFESLCVKQADHRLRNDPRAAIRSKIRWFIGVTSVFSALHCACQPFIEDADGTPNISAITWKCPENSSVIGGRSVCILFEVMDIVLYGWGIMSYGSLPLLYICICSLMERSVDSINGLLRDCISAPEEDLKTLRRKYRNILEHRRRLLKVALDVENRVSGPIFFWLLHAVFVVVMYTPLLFTCNEEPESVSRLKYSLLVVYFVYVASLVSWRAAEIQNVNKRADVYLQEILIHHYLSRTAGSALQESPATSLIMNDGQVLMAHFSCCTISLTAGGFFLFSRSFIISIATGLLSYSALVYQLVADGEACRQKTAANVSAKTY